MTAKHSSHIGQTLKERYLIQELIGTGSMGQVFKILDKKDSKTKALKLVNIHKNKVPFEALMRFRTEGDILRKLQHPFIIKYYDFFNEGDLYGLVMEYLSSPSLSGFLRKSGPFSMEKALFLVKTLTKALVFIHDKKLVHLDLKPSNIMLTFDESEQMSLKILDFGFSQIIGMSDSKTGGTLSYMAPEQTGILHKTIDHRADLYAMGIILYEVLVGQVPFKDSDPAMLVYQHIAQTPPKPSSIRSDIPAIFENILLKLISKDPEDRYRTTNGLLNDLEKYERLSQEENPNDINFELGMDDHWDSFPQSNPFVGRIKEKQIVRKIIESVTAKPLKENQSFKFQTNQGKKPIDRYKPVEGKGGIVLIEGRKGNGKTVLLTELFNELQSKPGITWFHQAIKEEYETPFKSVRTLLANLELYIKRLSHAQSYTVQKYLKKRVKDQLGIVQDLVPNLSAFIGLEKEQDTSPMVRNRTVDDYLEVIFNLLDQITRIEKRLVVFIDGFENVESASVELIFKLIERFNKLPILVVMAYNYEELSIPHRAQIAKHVEKEYCTHIVLSPLNEGEVATLLQRLFSNKLFDMPIILDSLYAATQGNPSLLRNILQKLIDRRLIYYEKNTWKSKTDEIIQFIRTQRTVNATLAPLIDWTDDELNTLSRGSIFLRSFSFDALKHLCCVEPVIELEEKKLLTILDKALQASVLFVNSQKLYSFSDNDTRYALLSDLNTELKRNLYKTVARYLEENVLPKQPEAVCDIARHWERAGEQENAMQFYVRSARLTDNGMFDDRQAELYYRKALLCLKQLKETKISAGEQFEIRYSAIRHTLVFSREYDQLWQELLDIEPFVGDDKIRYIRMQSLKAGLSFLMGRKKDMLAYGQTLLDLEIEPDEEKYIAESVIQMGSVVSDKSYRERIELLKKGLDIALRNNLFHLSIGPATALSILYSYLLEFDKAETAIRDLEEKIVDDSLKEFKDIAFTWPKIFLELERGNFRKAIEFSQALAQYQGQAGPIADGMMQNSLAYAHGMLGNFGESLQIYDKQLASIEKAQQRVEVLPAYFGRIEVALRMKQPETALEFIEKVKPILQLRHDPYMECRFLIQAASANLELLQFEESHKYLNDAIAIAEKLNSPLLDYHLNFARHRLNWLTTGDPKHIQSAHTMLDEMLANGVTGFYELFKEALDQWQVHPARSSTSLSSYKSGDLNLLKLFEISYKITTTHKLEDLFEAALEGAMQLTGANHGYLFTCPNLENCSYDDIMSPRTSRNALGEVIDEEKQCYSTSLLKTAMDTKEIIVTRDARNEDLWKDKTSISDHNLRSILVAPIIFDEILKGFIYLDNHHATSVFTMKDRETVGVFATQVAIALNNAESFARQQEITAENVRLYQEIKEHNITLEKQVEERTKELKEKTEQLQELNRDLEARVTKELDRRMEQEQLMVQQSKMAAMGEMIGMIAHQWRQPLSSISTVAGNIQIFMELDRMEKDELSPLLNTINEQVQFLSNTINDFRDFFSPKKRAELVNLGEILAKTMKLIGKSLENKNIKLESNCNFSKPIITYSNEVMQVFLNILKNAQDTIEEKGIESPKIFISSEESETYQTITIEDNAGGIPDDYLEKIFEPYFSTKDEKTGTGLGLYMSKMIVEKHCGGQIIVTNTDQGARFEIKLPIENEELKAKADIFT